jgi:hypothetical protein
MTEGNNLPDDFSSPLPWTTSGDSPENPPMIWAADGDGIVNQMPDGTPYFEPETAELIVVAVNCHDSLVKALEAALDLPVTHDHGCSIDAPCRHCTVNAQIRAALSAAGGG